MKSWIIDLLLSNSGGYLSSILLIDLLLLGLLLLIIWNLVLPALHNYRLAKRLDLICGTDTKHWFYGHTKKVGA